MSLSKEAYYLIVKYVGRKSDLCSLARVSKLFQPPAERALYNTMVMREPLVTIALCELLSTCDRLAVLVDALTIFAYEEEEELPDIYWNALSNTLRSLTKLRFLNIYVNGDSTQTWILDECTFRLQTFHCDLSWDNSLKSFLQNQPLLSDLFLSDYSNVIQEPDDSMSEDIASTFGPQTLPRLSILECGFIDAISTLVPGRPLVKVKTCFSRESIPEKLEELSRLLAGLHLSTSTICSLDLADSSYTEDFSLTMLSEVARFLPGLRYLGTLVLPIGRERLNFFGLLMRLRQLRGIELEVTEWNPAPQSAGLRALASELRLYCPSIICVVFVQEFERTVIRVINGLCTIDTDYNAENLWRDIM